MNPTSAQMVNYLNDNKDEMVCAEYVFGPITYLQDQKGYSNEFNNRFFGEFIGKLNDTGPNGPKLDLNAVTYDKIEETYRPVTFLDQVNEQLRYNKEHGISYQQVPNLKTWLLKLGAKGFHELPKSKQKKYLEKRIKDINAWNKSEYVHKFGKINL